METKPWSVADVGTKILHTGKSYADGRYYDDYEGEIIAFSEDFQLIKMRSLEDRVWYLRWLGRYYEENWEIAADCVRITHK